MINLLSQTIVEIDKPTKLVVEQTPHYLEIGIIITLFSLLFVIIIVVAYIYRSVTFENRQSGERLHQRHREERKEWNRENKNTVERVERVVTELTGTIRATNIHIQQNTDGSLGTQAQTGNSNG